MTADSEKSTDSVHAEQIAYWNGRAGAAWTDLHTRTDEMLAPTSKVLLEGARLQPGERVLDVGCGCGDTTLRAGDAVGPGGSVVGLDVSEPMLATARERAVGHPQLDFRLEDAATARFEVPFDVAISRFGVMFFGEPAAAFTSIARSLRAGARIVFVCWQHPSENEWVTVPMIAAKPFVPEAVTPAPGTPGPFAFADRARVQSILEAAGFTNVTIDSHQAPLSMGRDPDDVLLQLGKIGPLARAAADVGPEEAAKALGSARDAIVARSPAGPYTLGGAFWLVAARRGADVDRRRHPL